MIFNIGRKIQTKPKTIQSNTLTKTLATTEEALTTAKQIIASKDITIANKTETIAKKNEKYKKKNKDIPTGSELRQLVGLNPLKPPNLNKATFEKARKRSKNNEWAENDELAILAYLYNTCIVVYQSGVSATFDRWSIIMPDVNECEKDQTIYLYNTKRLHFDVLVNLKPV